MAFCESSWVGHLVVSNASPPEVTSGVELLARGAADVSERGDPAELCKGHDTCFKVQRHLWCMPQDRSI